LQLKPIAGIYIPSEAEDLTNLIARTIHPGTTLISFVTLVVNNGSPKFHLLSTNSRNTLQGKSSSLLSPLKRIEKGDWGEQND